MSNDANVSLSVRGGVDPGDQHGEDGATRRRPTGWHLQFLSSTWLWLSHRSPMRAVVPLTAALLHTVMPVFSTFTPAIHSTKEKEEGLQTLGKLPFWGAVCALLSCHFRNFNFFFWMTFDWSLISLLNVIEIQINSDQDAQRSVVWTAFKMSFSNLFQRSIDHSDHCCP